MRILEAGTIFCFIGGATAAECIPLCVLLLAISFSCGFICAKLCEREDKE